MNNLQIFNNDQFGQVRTVMQNGEPWFVGKDVCNILGYSNSRDALIKHVDEDDKWVSQNATFESPRGLTVINESGLYSLILRSKLPEAKQFKRWVTHEVLPQIRKTGTYGAMVPQSLPEALRAYANEVEEHNKAKALIEAQKPKVLFADAVSTSHTSILIGDLAKLLKQNGYETGQKRLFEQLRQEGYLIKSGNSCNMPTQKSMELGLFEVKETTDQNSDGSLRITKTTKVTGKGQLYFINRYLKNHGEVGIKVN